MRSLLGIVALLAALGAPAAAQPLGPEAHARNKSKLNAWTVGLAGGLLEGAPLRFATDIARVTDAGDDMHVLPIVTRGPVENVEALLYLKGVDVAIINSDALQQFKSLVPDIHRRITYILNLFPSEFHVFARADINKLEDLRGKRVNFNTPGTSAAYSGSLIFDKLGVEVERTYMPHPVALEQMKNGDMAAVVFVTSKPIDLLARSQWPPGFKFLPVEWSNFDLYLPATLDDTDYPQLITKGQSVSTVAVPTILAAFNWPKSSQRYRRVSRFTEYLFSRMDRLQTAGFHPKWKDVSLRSEVPGLTRIAAAQEWLNRTSAGGSPSRESESATRGVVTEQAASGDEFRALMRAAPGNRVEKERLVREFMEWRRSR